jgi:hypothetical protein
MSRVRASRRTDAGAPQAIWKIAVATNAAPRIVDPSR